MALHTFHSHNIKYRVLVTFIINHGHTIMKLLVIGHARHGKDTVCDILKERYGFKFTSSSDFCNAEIVFPVLQPKYNYTSLHHCYIDRVNHRKEWHDLIHEYNKDARLVKEILAKYDVYCGLRNLKEFQESEHLFDYIIWVDASERLPYESPESMQLNQSMVDIVIDNNGDQDDLIAIIDNTVKNLKG